METFKEWLSCEEIITEISTMMAIFLEDASLNASIANSNMQFSQIFGIQKNWFSIIMSQATKYVTGGDVLSLATDVANDILMSLHQKDSSDKFWQLVEPLIRAKDENQITPLFTRAVYLRSRRLAQKYYSTSRSKYIHTMSSLSDLTAGSRIRGNGRRSLPIGAGNFVDKSTTSQHVDRIQELRNAILKELQKMSDEAGDVRSRQRLLDAKAVAERGLDNPPHFPTLPELMAEFPHIKKGTMHNIIKDMRVAMRRIAPSQGIEGLEENEPVGIHTGSSDIEMRKAA